MPRNIKGDLVYVRGRIWQGSYVKDDEPRYTVDLICTDLSRLARPVEGATREYE